MTQTLPAGLAGVVVAETALGGVRGDEGFFHYRQYSAVDLARTRTLEDVWYLLHHGSLPTREQSREFARLTSRLRVLAPDVIEALGVVARLGSPDAPALVWTRTGASLLAQADGMSSWLYRDDAENLGYRLAAVMPTIVATMWRARQGLSVVTPRSDVAAVANFLWMLEGDLPDPARARALEQYLILTVDHGFNASTFAARVVASTGADLGAALVAGVGALSGPLHGGAPSLVVDMLNEIGSVDNAPAYAEATLARGEVIMGFGHRVYATTDPRSEMLKGVARSIGGPFVDMAVATEPILLDALARHRPGRDIRTNVEYYAGVVLYALGIEPVLYPALFAISRSIGWTAHIREQIAANRIIRPDSAYTGPPAPEPLPAP